jgi:hypothetical protein
LPAQAFSPTNLNGCALWLRADAGVVTSGGKVTTWQDQSDNNRNASQGIVDYQPTKVDSGLNGHPVIRFDGSNDGLSLGNIGSAFPIAATLFVVSTIRDNMYNLVTTDQGTTSSNPRDYTDTWWRFDWQTTCSSPGMFRSAGNRIGNYMPGPNSGAHVFAVESSSSKWEMWIDGFSGGVAGAAYGGGDEYRIGMPDDTPAPTGTGQDWKYLNGDIAEIIIYNRALTEAERNQVGFYLSDRYGLITTYEGPPPAPPAPPRHAADHQVAVRV